MGNEFNKLITELPKKNEGTVINWKVITDMDFNILYHNVEYIVHIIECKNSRVYFTFNKKSYNMHYSHFKDCKFGNIFGVYSKEYEYNIGDIIENKTSKIKILEQIRISSNSKSSDNRTDKGYKYECLNCGNIDIILESHLKEDKGCNVCCVPSQKILKGYNDIATTHPYLVKYFVSIEDTYKYSYSSRDKALMKCPICGREKEMVIYSLYFNGFACICSDGFSYPEKIMYNILEKLQLNFKTQLSKTTFKWCKQYKYDFYFKFNNEEYIIETHGLQHYQEKRRGRTLKEEQENDKLKKELALQNGIKEENYVVIDCKYSDLEWIKNNDNGILKSRLNDLFDLSIIDWIRAEEFALSSLVKKACEIKHNNPNMTTTQIGEIMNLNYQTIKNYLKKGSKIWNWVGYDPNEEKRKISIKNGIANGKQVICIETKEIYESITQAFNKTGINNISACCRGQREFAGNLKWMYYEEYLKLKF